MIEDETDRQKLYRAWAERDAAYAALDELATQAKRVGDWIANGIGRTGEPAEYDLKQTEKIAHALASAYVHARELLAKRRHA